MPTQSASIRTGVYELMARFVLKAQSDHARRSVVRLRFFVATFTRSRRGLARREEHR